MARLELTIGALAALAVSGGLLKEDQCDTQICERLADGEDITGIDQICHALGGPVILPPDAKKGLDGAVAHCDEDADVQITRACAAQALRETMESDVRLSKRMPKLTVEAEKETGKCE